MKKTLRLIALLLALAAVGGWAAAGANRGWTKTEVQVKTLDEITGIEGITYQKKFQPGVDLLGLALGGAGALFASSFFFRKSIKPNR